MARDPFGPLMREKKVAARLQRWRRAALRPLRPSRIRPDRPGPPSLLLVGVDTLRWDHLGMAGYRRPTTPQLDSLARGGVVFGDVMAPAPWTLASFASSLTGVMPGLHGARLVGEIRNMDAQPPQRLRPGTVTLAGHLAAQGYATCAFYANEFFTFGLAESFAEHTYYNQPASEVCARAWDWIRQNGDRPFVCFVLLNDPHEPTTPQPRDLAPLLDEVEHDGAPIGAGLLRALARWGQPDAPKRNLGSGEWPLSAQMKRLREVKLALYDATIGEVDRAVGDLWKRFCDKGLDRNTVGVVYADHGEEFLDHAAEARTWNHDPRPVRAVGHGHSQFQELLHVPWLAWGPGVPAGVVWEEPVSLCDLAPTVCEWLGLPPLPLPAETCAGLVGRSLAPLLRPEAVGQDTARRWLLAEAVAYGPDLVAVRRDRWKLIAHRDGRPLGLYDLARDPAERDDRQAQHPEVLRELQAHLVRWREAVAPTAGSGDRGQAGWRDLDAEVRKRLKDLGYGE